MFTRSTDVHVFNYPTNAVVVVLHFAPPEDIVKGWAELMADGSGMVRGWYHHKTMAAAWKSAFDAATHSQSLGDKVNVIHHDCT